MSLNQVAPTLSLIWPVRNSSFLSKFQGLILGSTRYTNSVQFYSAPRFVFVKTMACQSQQPSDVQAESTTPGHIHMPPRKKGLEKSKKRKECKNLIYDLLIKILRAMLGGVGWPGLVSGVWICGCCFNFSRGFLQQLSVPRDQGPHEDGTAKILDEVQGNLPSSLAPCCNPHEFQLWLWHKLLVAISLLVFHCLRACATFPSASFQQWEMQLGGCSHFLFRRWILSMLVPVALVFAWNNCFRLKTGWWLQKKPYCIY